MDKEKQKSAKPLPSGTEQQTTYECLEKRKKARSEILLYKSTTQTLTNSKCTFKNKNVDNCGKTKKKKNNNIATP
jgi:hypothetical protein